MMKIGFERGIVGDVVMRLRDRVLPIPKSGAKDV
jgi:hypothetical protein